MMKIVSLVILISLSLYGHSQVDDIVLQRCYGTFKSDDAQVEYPQCIELIPEGFIIGIDMGFDDPGISNFHGGADMWIAKLDSLGNIIWERCYGGSDGDWIHKIIAVNDSIYYLFGGSFSQDGDVQNTRPGEFWVAKIDSAGTIIWENNYGSIPEAGEARDAIAAPDGGLIFMARIVCAGGDVSTYYGQNDIWVCRLDPDGNILWEETLGNYHNENAVNMILTNDNTILVAGGHYETAGMITCPDLGDYGADCWIVEMDLDGNIIRQLCYGGSYDEVIYDIVEVEDGYVFIAWTNSNDQDVSGFHGVAGEEASYDIWACKISYPGEIQWEKCLGGSQYEAPNYIASTLDGGFVIFGYTNSHDGDVSNNHSYELEQDIWIVKLDSLGNLMWEHCFGGKYKERFWGSHSVAKRSDDNFAVLAISKFNDGDVECDMYGFQDYDAWFFEIKDCNNYMPQIPSKPTGPDTLCTTVDSISTFSTTQTQGAWYYEWQVLPVEAGIFQYDSSQTTAKLHWSTNWEGQAEISVRSWNDCGQSLWSEVKSSWAYSCLGLAETGEGLIDFVLFPNPATDFVYVNVKGERRREKGEKSSFYIYDIYGRLVLKEHIVESQDRIDISAYMPGIYFVVLRDKNEIIGRKKFVVR